MGIIVGYGKNLAKITMKTNCYICAYSKSRSLRDPRQDTFFCSPCQKSWFRGKSGEGIEFFTCKHCGKPFKKLRVWKEEEALTFTLSYTPILANHLKHSHREIYEQYQPPRLSRLPEGRKLEQLERENALLVKGTAGDYSRLQQQFLDYEK